MFICHGVGNGGAERVILTLAEEFLNRKYKVFLTVTTPEKNDYVINPNIHFIRIIPKGKNVLLRAGSKIQQIRKIVKTNNIESIISFSSITNIQTLIATFFLNRRIIISERTDPSYYPKSIFLKIIRKIIYPLADYIVFQTEMAREYFGYSIRKKSVIIPNPIRKDMPQRYKGERNKKIIGIGSLGEQKNWDMSLKACEILFKKHNDYIMEIYGDGPDKNRLQEKINSSPFLKNNVFLMGFSHNAVNEMRKATMYISSSIYEGISNSMLEALAVGTPAICTDCPVGGARKYIKNGINGILVKVNDYEDLAYQMEKIITDKKFASSLSNESIKIKKEIELEKIAECWERLLY